VPNDKDNRLARVEVPALGMLATNFRWPQVEMYTVDWQKGMRRTAPELIRIRPSKSSDAKPSLEFTGWVPWIRPDPRPLMIQQISEGIAAYYLPSNL